MRILWIAPWGRALARVYLDAVRDAGHQVMLITTGRHYEKPTEQRGYERLLTGIPRQPSSWPRTVAVLRAARRFRPDVVVTEEIHDPRLLPLVGSTPTATIVHDDQPHDESERGAWHHRFVMRRSAAAADLLLTFSNSVAEGVRARWDRPIATLPLPSDAGEHLAPPFVAGPDRCDMVLIGRLGPYKNIPLTLRAWERHVASDAYRGDRLIIVGDGPADALGPLPRACEWRRGPYQFAEVMPLLARAKASLAYYSMATQSGVQVISMQCGTSVLVSDVGGLPEYLPPGEKPVAGSDDPLALAEAIGELADPAVAAHRGRAARAHYETVHHPRVAADALLAVLDRLARDRAAAAGT